MKNDLYPSRERLLHCHKVSSSKYLNCSEADSHGHYLICSANRYVCSPLTSVLSKYPPHSALENVVNCDIQCSTKETFIILWLLANTSVYIWNCFRLGQASTLTSFQGILKAKLNIMSHIPSYKNLKDALDPIVLSVDTINYM